MFKTIIFILFAACSLTAATETPEKVTLQFLSFPKATEPEPLELVVGEGETIEVNIPTNHISEPYEIPYLSSWKLGKTTEDEEGNPKFRVLGETSAINKSKQLVLVIRNGYDNSRGLKMIAMPNDDSKIGGGSFFFINMAADYQIAGKITDAQFAIKPGQSVVIEPKASETKGSYKYCEALLVYRKGEKTRPFYTQTWRLSDQVRSFIFFYQDRTTGKLKMHTIEDHLF